MSEGAAHGAGYYIKIWAILVVLLVISILGPEMNIPVLTLITAFGIAIVKALMVAAHFMHLNIEIRYIWYLLICGVIALLVMFVGLAPDIMKPDGVNWENCMRTQTCVEQRL